MRLTFFIYGGIRYRIGELE